MTWTKPSPPTIWEDWSEFPDMWGTVTPGFFTPPGSMSSLTWTNYLSDRSFDLTNRKFYFQVKPWIDGAGSSYGWLTPSELLDWWFGVEWHLEGGTFMIRSWAGNVFPDWEVVNWNPNNSFWVVIQNAGEGVQVLLGPTVDSLTVWEDVEGPSELNFQVDFLYPEEGVDPPHDQFSVLALGGIEDEIGLITQWDKCHTPPAAWEYCDL